MSELAQAIRDARGLKTKVGFAADMGVTRQTVAAWENGTHKPDYEAAVMLEDLGVPRALLIAGHAAPSAKATAA